MPAAAITLEAPQLLGTADLDADVLTTIKTWLAARTERPATSVFPTWRVTPEGLTVFLI